MSVQPMQTDIVKKAPHKMSIQKTLSYMLSNLYSIINNMLPEFVNKIFKNNIIKIIKICIQEEFNLNLHNKQRFFVMRAVLHYSVTWLVATVVPRSLMFLVLAEPVFSYCFFRQGEFIADTLLWQFCLDSS